MLNIIGYSRVFSVKFVSVLISFFFVPQKYFRAENIVNTEHNQISSSDFV